MKKTGKCKRVVVAGCLVQRHKTKLLADARRSIGWSASSIASTSSKPSAARRTRGRSMGISWGSITICRASLAAGRSRSSSRGRRSSETKTNRLPVFEDDRARLRLTPRHYAYLRISEGCNQGCTFCTIPSIRGPMRSKPIEQILAEAQELAADGAVELNLIGQDTTSYGTDIGYAAGPVGLAHERSIAN